MIGRVLSGRYRIDSEIGGGGMAEVYKAFDLTLRRPVAVKILRSEYGRDPDFVRRFRQEAMAAASLTDPNIVDVYDVGEADDVHYIVMELVEGMTLKEYIQKKGALPVAEALTVGSSIASALMAAHKKGIIHRDIKPENILVTDTGDVKVADFGIARAASGKTIVHTGNIVGSAHYFSPEQARGGYLDEKSDLYSLGAILYEMLTRRTPFDGPTPIAVALRHLQDEPVAIHRIRQDVPRPVEAIVSRLMAKSPEDRPSATVAQATLSQAAAAAGGAARLNIQGEGEKPVHVNPIETAPQPPRRRLRAVYLWGIGAIVVAAVLFLGMRALANWVNAPTVTVPKLAGKNLAYVENLLHSKNLQWQISTRELSGLPAGSVITSTPGAGEVVKEGRVIFLVVSSGILKVSVPDVLKEPYAIAYKDLVASNLKIYTPTYVLSTDPPGTVVAQTPQPGTKVAVGTKIHLQISKGNANLTLTMPNLVGQSVQAAGNQLTSLGLVMNATSYAPSSAPDGTVIEQSVVAGGQVSSGQAINLTLSSGAPPSGGTGPAQSQTITLSYSGTQAAEVRIVMVDVQGIRVLYDQMVPSGGTIPLTVNWEGSGRLEEYVSGQLVLSTDMPLTNQTTVPSP